MRGKFKLDNVSEMIASMTITMTMGEWNLLLEQMTNGPYPQWQVARLIRSLVDKSCAEFNLEEEISV